MWSRTSCTSTLSQCTSRVDYEAAVDLAKRACINEVLQCTGLGGKPNWCVDDFLSRDVWDEHGGKSGLKPVKAVSIKLMIVIAAAGQKPKPIDPFCHDCKELKFHHAASPATAACKLNPDCVQVRPIGSGGR